MGDWNLQTPVRRRVSHMKQVREHLYQVPWHWVFGQRVVALIDLQSKYFKSHLSSIHCAA